MGRTQEVSFEYLKWSPLYEEEKPYEIFLDDISKLKGLERTNLVFEKGPIQHAQDVRGEERCYSLDTHGFAWVKNDINVDDLRSEEGILQTYIPAMERLLQETVEGADRVIIFDWRTRLSTSKEDFERRTVDLNSGLDPLQPVTHPHVDQTPEGSIARAFHHIGAEAEHLLRGRFRIMNVWRPLDIVENWPLAVCDGRSVHEDDLVASDFIRRHYQGETYFATYSDSYRWHFLSQQRPDEALLFKVYDSSDDVESKHCLHASFPVHDGAEMKRPRQSIECRAMVFTHPAGEFEDARSQHRETIPKSFTHSMIYGTAGKGDRTAQTVMSAIGAGFRAFDTAAQPEHYDEALLGQAIREAISQGLVKREELWVQTKFSNIQDRAAKNMPYDPSARIAEQIRCSVESSLSNLASVKDTYIDCVILHAPLATMEETLEAWDALSSFVPDRVRSLGISNAAVTAVSILYNKARVKPSIVQNRFCKRTGYDAQVRQFCKNHGIVYQGFGLLRDSPDLLDSSAVQRLADVVGVSKEQALYALVRAIGVVPLNGTSREERMLSDLAALDSVSKWRSDAVNGSLWKDVLRDFEKEIA